MKKTKILALTLALTLTLGAFAACGNHAAETVPSATPTANPGAPLPPFELKEIGERWYEDTTLEVIPREDYGAVYPYLGGTINRGFPAMEPVSLYGFATADGKIICDAAFSKVTEYTSGGKAVYLARRDTGKYSQYMDYNNYSGEENYSDEDTYKYYLIAGDGSYVFEYDDIVSAQGNVYTEYYGYGAIANAPGYYFAVKIGDKWGAIDYDGNTVLPCEYAFPPYFGDGLFVVSDWADDETSGSSETQLLEYWYVDPFIDSLDQSVTPKFPMKTMPNAEFYGESWQNYCLRQLVFSSGRAPLLSGESDVFDENNAAPVYGYIDKTGTLVIPANFIAMGNYGAPFDGNGYAHVTLRGNGWSDTRVIDRDGNEVPEYVAAYAGAPQDSGILYAETTWDWSDGYAAPTTKFIDRDGKVAYSYDADAQKLGGGWFTLTTYSPQGTSVTSKLWKDGKSYCAIDGQFWFRLSDTRFVAMVGNGAQIIDIDGNVLYDTKARGMSSVWNVRDGEDGRVYIEHSANYPNVTVEVVSPDGEIIIPEKFTDFDQYGEFYTARLGYYGGLIDKSGEWVVKVSLLDSLAD
jgi:hypothetical protein